ncbi:MAG: hypothetical protein ABI589_02005 [Burkholderiales bacterium]
MTAALCLLISAYCLLAYDRFIARPARLIGVVDVAEVYRAKENEFATYLTTSKSDSEREKALALATDFAKRLPAALEELPRECGCLVMLNSAVVGRSRNTVDLTALLQEKLARP